MPCCAGRLLTELRAALRFADASRQAAERGDIAVGIAETARAAFLDRQLATLQSEQDLAENIIALELLSGALKESWPH